MTGLARASPPRQLVVSPSGPGVGVTGVVYASDGKGAIRCDGQQGLRRAKWIVIEFCPRHADLHSRGRGDRFPPRTIVGAARTYGLVRGPRPGARPALSG